jgi:hypothetical protein
MGVTALSRAVASEGLRVADIYGDLNLWMQVDFAWDAVGGADSYQVEVGTTPGGTEYQVTNVGNVLSWSANFPPGTYYFRVRAVNSGTPGTPSADQVFFA